MACGHTSAAVGSAQLLTRRWLLAVLLAMAGSACATGAIKPPTGTPEPDKFLFERGSERLNERKWITAREYFRHLVDTYPQSTYRADAKLGVGDTYLGEGTTEGFILAISEFREFLTFYPTHPRADYAQFKLGMAHFYQMRRAERDQTETREAIKELTVFAERFGGTSSLAAEAAGRLREAKDRLADSEYRVGFFYYRSKWYPGAVDRFKAVIERDPQYSNRDALYFHLADSLIKLKRPAEALPYFDRLVAEFERSEYLAEAQKRVAELKGTVVNKTGAW
jgi:outer membrane protein assembly factor BamD